jgi:hypothetical protein
MLIRIFALVLEVNRDLRDARHDESVFWP